MTLFAAHRAILGWSHREIARRLGCDVALPIRWESGKAETPPQIAKWMERLARCVERQPAPTDWRVK